MPQMTVSLPIPAAQYLRMSTERQEYSIPYQSQAIAKYAESHGFSIVQTYSDAITGVVFKKRKGLQKLIQEVVLGRASYKAILVYDVTRWGRFLDIDESAHYEFLCKSAGVRVHYCAETFPNDDTLPSMIMKSLKRAMACDFVRELGEKVSAGQRRGASLGFRQGAVPGYGLRRLLVSADGIPKQVLAPGERKSIANNRIVLVHGPAEEVQCVHDIYQMFIHRRMTFSEIARELNRRNVKYVENSKWSLRAVQTILTHPKYMGCNVYGRYSQRLYTPPIPRPRSEWTIKPKAFDALVEPATYARAQRILEQTHTEYPRNRSDKELLDALRKILAKHGRITIDLIKATPRTPSAQTYNARFGTLSRAYDLIGYTGFWRNGWLETRRRIQTLRNDLMRQIVSVDPTRVSIENRGGSYRTRLRMQDGRLVSVLVSRPVRYYKDKVYWLLFPRDGEHRLITLVARLNLECTTFKDVLVIPPPGRAIAIYAKDADPRLQKGIRLTNVRDFCGAIEKFSNED
jgi:DNA invertase Pin-like site-specific DNA recombinase